MKESYLSKLFFVSSSLFSFFQKIISFDKKSFRFPLYFYWMNLKVIQSSNGLFFFFNILKGSVGFFKRDQNNENPKQEWSRLKGSLEKRKRININLFIPVSENDSGLEHTIFSYFINKNNNNSNNNKNCKFRKFQFFFLTERTNSQTKSTQSIKFLPQFKQQKSR